MYTYPEAIWTCIHRHRHRAHICNSSLELWFTTRFDYHHPTHCGSHCVFIKLTLHLLQVWIRIKIGSMYIWQVNAGHCVASCMHFRHWRWGTTLLVLAWVIHYMQVNCKDSESHVNLVIWVPNVGSTSISLFSDSDTHTLSLLATLWNCVLHSGWNVNSYIKQ